MSNDWNCNVHIGFSSANCKKTFSVQKENAPSLFSRMYHVRSRVDRNSRSAHHGKTQNSTQKSIQPKPNPTLQALPSPLPPTLYPLSLTPGIVRRDISIVNVNEDY